MATQWERLLKNQGTWVGSFTQIAPSGEILRDIPSEVVLQPLDSGQTMHQVVRKYPAGESPEEITLNYRSLGRGVLFCETGAFSQGSLQWSPVSDFGAELGLIHQNERLRVVLTFPRQPQLGSLTLIREHLQGTEPTQRPSLSSEQLIGTWVGRAVTVFPDWQPEQTMETKLSLHQSGTHELEQTLQFGQSPPICTQGQQIGSSLKFDQGQQPVTVLLMAHGASVAFPSSIQPGQPLFLEAGWLISPDLRQRLIRTYNQRGSLTSITLVTETKQP